MLTYFLRYKIKGGIPVCENSRLILLICSGVSVSHSPRMQAEIETDGKICLACTVPCCESSYTCIWAWGSTGWGRGERMPNDIRLLKVAHKLSAFSQLMVV